MLSIAIVTAGAIALASLTCYMSYYYGEIKGYERGMDEAEEVISEVYSEARRLSGSKHRER